MYGHRGTSKKNRHMMLTREEVEAILKERLPDIRQPERECYAIAIATRSAATEGQTVLLTPNFVCFIPSARIASIKKEKEEAEQREREKGQGVE